MEPGHGDEENEMDLETMRRNAAAMHPHMRHLNREAADFVLTFGRRRTSTIRVGPFAVILTPFARRWASTIAECEGWA
jgi:hypothetical protein